jgi:V/A-type H+/Na+-transporting ATPase subunit D
MAKIKLTKNELKKQKDNLKRFVRYLPTLELKKKQLLQEIQKVQAVVDRCREDIARLQEEVYRWADVFADKINLESLFRVGQVQTDTGNIAGIDIPIFRGVVFIDEPVDFFLTPLWVDRGIEVCKLQIRLLEEQKVAEKQQDILRDELRITTQRIKLFEEVKIPEARENIRVIQIFLGDQQTAAVVRGKIAKAKIEKKKQEAEAA